MRSRRTTVTARAHAQLHGNANANAGLGGAPINQLENENENEADSENVSPTAPAPAPMPASALDAHRLQCQKLALSTPVAPARAPLGLGAPFSLARADNNGTRVFHAERAFDLSPPSSASSGSSDFDFGSPASSARGQDAFDAFVATRSRVVRGLAPATLWTLRAPAKEDGREGRGEKEGWEGCVWAVFRTHAEACAALALSPSPSSPSPSSLSQSLSAAPALEADLEPFAKLARVPLPPPLSAVQLYDTSSSSVAREAFGSLGAAGMEDYGYAQDYAQDYALGLGLGQQDFPLSTNPPSPSPSARGGGGTAFRLGDWICRAPGCAAHNFGRNLTCIACACPRSPPGNGNGNAPHDAPHEPHYSPHSSYLWALQNQAQAPRAQASPRFASASASASASSFASASVPGLMQYAPGPGLGASASAYAPQSPPAYARAAPPPQQSYLSSMHAQGVVTLPPPLPRSPPHTHHKALSASASAHAHQTHQTHQTHQVHQGHPLLTPSGRAFALGGKVQNVSPNPLNPCVLYWPDNEAFPEEGQIRPSGLMGVPPPILNTGNRGPISHQPGDWICLKCNYLNWRRRKVCQTCLPYAEGNGDSISAAVQAERIALLTSVLAQTRVSSPAPGSSAAYPSPSSASAYASPSSGAAYASPGSAAGYQGHGYPPPIGRAHPRAHSTTPAQAQRPFVDFSPPHTHQHPQAHPQAHPQQQQQQTQTQTQQQQQLFRAPVHRSHSHSELGNAGSLGSSASPIYQTAPHQHGQQSQSPYQSLYQTQSQSQARQHHPSPLQRHTLSMDACSSPVYERYGDGGGYKGGAGAGYGGERERYGGERERERERERDMRGELYAPAPSALLPAFLHDIVHSPTLGLSPASTSSADLSLDSLDSLEGYEYGYGYDGCDGEGYGRGGDGEGDEGEGESLPSSATRSTFSHGSGSAGGGDSAHASPLANIWRLDGEESKSLKAFARPRRGGGLVGGGGSAASSRNSSLDSERLRVRVAAS
ncbi:hypothetical protein B0H15DRAFT_806856 [Mycena belliarum]|uniref:RanBP2-type domain-containing protein n=1 Tax=Mycena belliarum TaxID=1033014 RepID=A0AAD6XIJ6_9AGAR|nr:hypothetical protein B0H15DRAFT_806856 [Mycena belliae]